MTKLSPKAKAIMDVFDNEYYHKAKLRQVALAAVFRVLADNVAPENYACSSGHREWDEALETRNESIREAILDIAIELEVL